MDYKVYVLKDKRGKVYVGTTSTSLRVRFNHGNGYRFCKPLWEVICEDGWESIEQIVAADGLSEAEASEMEQRLIAEYDSTNPEKGYNRELGGLGKRKVISDTTKAKFSARKGPLNGNFGKHFTEEHKRKLSESNRGQKRSPEACAKNSAVHSKPVAQYTLDGVLVATFPNAKTASEVTGAGRSYISKVCLGKARTSGGYVWKFV